METNQTLQSEKLIDELMRGKLNIENRVCEDLLKHLKNIIKNPDMCENERDREFASATSDYIAALNSDCSKEKNKLLKSAKEHIKRVKETFGFYSLYDNLIDDLQSKIDSLGDDTN